jgi:hypothetical protein
VIRRVRMARKRLMVARERFVRAQHLKRTSGPRRYHARQRRLWDAEDALRAIERRKDAIK